MATRVTTNVFSRFGVVRVVSDGRVIRGRSCVDVWDMSEVLARKHFLGNVLTEFHYLFSDVSKECVAGPATNQHDHEDWAFSEVHCHGRARSNRVCANVFLVEAKPGFPNCAHRVS
jgi:hypothetical protein